MYWEKGDNARLDGKMQMHHRLAFDEGGEPMLYVFSTCRHFSRTVPNLVYSERDVEDVDTDGEDHAYDACRYLLMANPIEARIKAEPVVRELNPLGSEEQEDRYQWYRKY